VYNRALGVAEQPDRIGDALAFFAEHGVTGELTLAPGDVPSGVEPTVRLEAYLDAPNGIDSEPVDGLAIRVVGAEAADAWMDIILAAYEPDAETAALWRSMAPHLAAHPGRRLLTGALDGRVVAASSIQLTDDGAWISWAGVVPAARGHGIQRAMITARARLATQLGGEPVAAWALAGAHSSANLAAVGLRPIGERVSVRAADLG
jgi:GNAT superfamily N-acetyltransferase